MELALVSDSHVPERAAAIPQAFVDRIEAADHVVHAGDFTSPEALAEVRELADGLTAVYGNMDGRDLDLPAVATLEAGGATFVVTHGSGPTEGYEERVAGVVREEAGQDAIGVSGHTHEVLDGEVDGIRLLNPGSVTGVPPAERTTMMTGVVEDGGVDVTIHELEGSF